MVIRKGDQVTGLPHDVTEQVTVSNVTRRSVSVVVDGSYKHLPINQLVFSSEKGSIRYYQYTEQPARTHDPAWTAAVAYLGQTTRLTIYAKTQGAARNKAVGVMAKKCNLNIRTMAFHLRGTAVTIKPVETK